MRDFDAERNLREQRDRTFKIAGRDFEFRAAVTPETFAQYVDLVSGKLELSETEAIAVLDDTIKAFLTEHHRPLWDAARTDAELANPITSADMHDLITFMWETVTGRPTERPSDSGGGPGSNGTTLTPELPSVAAVS